MENLLQISLNILGALKIINFMEKADRKILKLIIVLTVFTKMDLKSKVLCNGQTKTKNLFMKGNLTKIKSLLKKVFDI